MNIPKKLLFLSWITALAAIPLAHANDADPGEPPVTAPFLKKEDSLCVNDW